MIATDSTTETEQYQDIFKRLAGALNPMLDGQVDESKVREIAAEEIGKARLPAPRASRPIATTAAGRVLRIG